MAAAVARGVARVARPALARAATLAPVARLPAVAPRCVSRFSTGTDSHDDFKPKVKAVATDEVQELIAKAVEASPVMLFMKGTPMQPLCGFSQQVVRILHAHGVAFDSMNVLESDALRNGIKEFSQWPTIPQLYVKGEFVGGCDIVTSLHQSGELGELLEEAQGSDE